MEKPTAEFFSIVLLDTYKEGDVISHGELQLLFCMQEPKIYNFSNHGDFMAALTKHQFDYMTKVEEVRNVLLTEFKIYLHNIRGIGYEFMPSVKQTGYAKRRMLDGIRKEMRQGGLIMENVMLGKLDADARRANSDELARLGQLKQMLKTALK